MAVGAHLPRGALVSPTGLVVDRCCMLFALTLTLRCEPCAMALLPHCTLGATSGMQSVVSSRIVAEDMYYRTCCRVDLQAPFQCARSRRNSRPRLLGTGGRLLAAG